MQRILGSVWLVLFLLAACGTPAAPTPVAVPADASAATAGGLPTVTVYKSPT